MRRLAAVLLVFLGAGCDAADPIVTTDLSSGAPVTSEAELLVARQAWQDARPASYRFSYIQVCEECSSGNTVAVRDGRIVRVERGRPEFERSIDDLFEVARGAFSNRNEGEVRLSATTPRFPVRIVYTASDTLVVGGGLSLVVTGFEAR